MESEKTGGGFSQKEVEGDYKDALDFLYSRLPMFSRVGGAAYKPGLQTSERLDEFFGHPHRQFKCIHVGGTNGKGSCSHTIAAILQAQGYKTGLYTSPHLVDFRERIRINGKMISKEGVTDFVKRWKECGYEGSPSFFELTMMMAFDWFARNKVEYAVIEVGMGGRLDSTNIITPVTTLITNISFDHTQFLGDTLEKIAAEKAGIIKEGIPAVVGEAEGNVRRVFAEKGASIGASLTFAQDNPPLKTAERDPLGGWKCRGESIGEFHAALSGYYQVKNINTILTAVSMLRSAGITLADDAVKQGFENVERTTGLRGRWTILSGCPLTICDTGHNEAGITDNMAQLESLMAEKRVAGKRSVLRMVIGFVSDKSIDKILKLLPADAEYYFTNAAIPRALDAGELAGRAAEAGLKGKVIPDVAKAYRTALSESAEDDIIYIGGSTFVVADLLASLE